MGFDLPEEGVEVHHIRGRGAGGPDEEWNLISLPGYVHEQEIHGLNVEIRRDVEARIMAYMQSLAVLTWRKDHAEELAAFYAEAEEAELRRRGRKYRIKKKPGWKF